MKILLIGYYGYGNIGDDALLKATLDSINAHADAECTVLSYNAEETQKNYGVNAISRGRHRALIRAIRQNDAVVVGGGSILQDITSSLSLYYYFVILMLARILGKKTYLAGNGYGPITKKYNQVIIRWLIKGLDGIVARDEKAYKAYKSLGARRLFNGVDLVYLLNSDDIAPIEEKHPYVVISLRPWHNTGALIGVMSDAINYLSSLGYKVYLLPMKQPDDTKLLTQLLNQCSNVEMIEHDIKTIIGRIKGSKFVIGMRLHALIFSAVAEVPFIGISYDPKVDSFVSQVMDTQPIQVQNASFELVKSEIDAILENYSRMQARVKASTASGRSVATEQMKTFLMWLKQDLRI